MHKIQDMRMTLLAFKVLFICTFLAAVFAQTPVASTNTITTGGKFSFYCDSARVVASSGNPASIVTLTLYRNITGGNYARVAQYISLAPPGENPEIKYPPSGRQWNFTFSGANGGSNNIASMKIVVDVNDTQCSDAGVYYCEVVYYYTGSGNSPPVSSSGQNVTVSMGLSSFDLTVDPNMDHYEVNDTVTFTCKAMGPSAAVNFKWELWTEWFGELSLQSLPNNAEVKTNPPTLQPSYTGCQQYSWQSTLSIQVPYDYDSQTYKCIVSYQQQQLTGNKTISVTPMPVTKPTTTTDITTTTDTTTTTDITTESWTPANQTASTDKPPTVRQDFQCHLTYMEVFIPVELVPNSVLTLRDPSPSCKLTNNGTHHTISFSYDECGTSETFYPNIVNVQNEISVHLDFNDTTEITFVDDYTIPLQCTVDRSKTLNGAIQVLPREGIAEHIVQSSEFYMKEFTTAEYNVEITDYPVKVPLNRQVFFELAVTNRTSSSSGILVEKCDASPTPNLNDTTSVSLIRDGCPDNPAVKVQPSVGIDRFRFSSQAFHFSAPANINNLVYVHCTVSTCRSECDITCPPRVRRKRRSAGRRLATATLTSGSYVVVNEG